MSVMTREEINEAPKGSLYYDCQQCKERYTDPKEVRLIVVMQIGFVMCKKCLEGDE